MTDSPSQIFVAKASFACELNGEKYIVVEDQTRVAGGHELVKAYPTRFQPIEPNADFQLEAATDVPGERRARASRRPSRAAATATKGELT